MESQSNKTQSVLIPILIVLIVIPILVWLTLNIKNHIRTEAEKTKNRIQQLQLSIDHLTSLSSQLKETPHEYCRTAKEYDLKYNTTLSKKCSEGVSQSVSESQQQISDELNRNENELRVQKNKGLLDFLPPWQTIFWTIMSIIGATFLKKVVESLYNCLAICIKKYMHARKKRL